MREYLFDDWRSVWHFFFGIALSLLVALGFGSIAAGAFLIYVIYEVEELERPVATVGDVEEAIIGYLFGHMVLHSDRLLEIVLG